MVTSAASSSQCRFLLSRVIPEQHQTISIFRVAAGVGSTANASSDLQAGATRAVSGPIQRSATLRRLCLGTLHSGSMLSNIRLGRMSLLF